MSVVRCRFILGDSEVEVEAEAEFEPDGPASSDSFVSTAIRMMLLLLLPLLRRKCCC